MTDAVNKIVAIAVGVGVLGGIVLFGVVGFRDDGSAAATPTAATTAVENRVDRTLGELQRTWNPVERERLLFFAASGSGGAVARDISRRLVEGDDRLAEAIAIAGQLADQNLLEPLRSLWLSGPKDLRPAVLRAIARCGGWEPEELARMAAVDSSARVRAAALQILAETKPRPLDAILRGLGDGDPRVRRIALTSIGDHLADEEISVVADFAQQASGAALAGAMRGLAGHVDPGLEAFLIEKLSEPETPVRIAALWALGSRDEPLRSASEIIAVAADPYQDAAVRALAAHCLERTGSFDGSQPLVWTGASDPAVAYFFARLAIRMGDPDGVQSLISIVETTDRAGSALTGSVVREAEQILGRLSGVGPRVAIARIRAATTTLRGIGEPLPLSRIPSFWLDPTER